jgi:RND family efflux transporter MFP subunit
MNALKKLFTLLLIPLVILLGAGGLVVFLIKTKPEQKKSTPVQLVPRVTVFTAIPSTHTPWIESFGTVRSFYETEIASLVAGEIVKVSSQFQAGKAVRKGDILVELNTADYLANLSQQKAAIADAKSTLIAEEARAKVAKHDWESSGRDIRKASPYSLRIPQIIAAKAAVQSAEAALAKAELDLDRCKIRAPYDAIVQERQANPGSIVGIGTPLGKLITREKSEVRLSLTPREVRQLQLPLAYSSNAKNSNPPLPVHLSSPAYPGTHWDGNITRTELSIDPRNQVVFVIAEIAKPFDSSPPLPIGTFVKARMQGKNLDHTLSLPESSIIDDQYVWVVDKNSTLRRQPITRLYSSQRKVLARLPQGDPDTHNVTKLTICTRPLPSFRKGQKVQPIPSGKSDT